MLAGLCIRCPIRAKASQMVYTYSLVPFLDILLAYICLGLNLVVYITHWIYCVIQDVALGRVSWNYECLLGYIMKQLWRCLSVEGEHLEVRQKQMRSLK